MVDLLLLFFCSVIQVQVQAGGQKTVTDVEQNALKGLIAVIISCISSGFAGVYFEKILKGSKGSVWLRNVQLAFFSAVLGVFGVWSKDGVAVAEKGVFYGFSPLVWFIIAIQAFGGLLVAVVIKFADNILKGFATSISIIVSTIVAVFLFNFSLTLMFVVGTTMVLAAVYMYSLPKPEPSLPASK